VPEKGKPCCGKNREGVFRGKERTPKKKGDQGGKEVLWGGKKFNPDLGKPSLWVISLELRFVTSTSHLIEGKSLRLTLTSRLVFS
jgi:hypothetical protein